MERWIRLSFFSIISIVGCFFLFYRETEGLGYLGIATGFFIGGLGIVTEYLIERSSLKSTLGGFFGLLIGISTGKLLLSIVGPILAGGIIGNIFFSLFSTLTFGYIGFVIGIKAGEELKIPNLISEKPSEGKERVNNLEIDTLDNLNRVNDKILDTSVIIDGRIADLCETGFLEGVFIIPQFILQELQHIADSSDHLKRARGRRGLDILNRIQKMGDIDVKIIEDDFNNIKEVDSKIVALAKKIGTKVMTNDLNLNKVAEFQGVRVLNINELCNALKPVVLPGEVMNVFVLKEGKEMGQGVAYLDDGTMIVVDDAKRCLGRNIDVVVTSVLQTTAGRMIFARLKEETEKEELNFART